MIFLCSILVELLFQGARFLTLIAAMVECTVISMVAFVLGNEPGGKRIGRQLWGRTSGPDSVYRRDTTREEKRRESFLFFCSSAGEYEQALPVMKRLIELTGVTPFILFQSRSGLDYATTRGEVHPCALAPPDNVWRWQSFDACHNIIGTAIIRHEWWPSFMYHFSKSRPLFLIDAAIPARDQGSHWKNAGRAFLATFFTRIYTIDSGTTDFFSDVLKIPEKTVAQTGDTKFDRVIDRAAATRLSPELTTRLRPHIHGKKIIVAGSIYREDLDVLTEAFTRDEELKKSWMVIAVPHHIDPLTTAQLEKQIDGLRDNFLVLPQMGVLAELYSIADVAWIGGACHNKVHNVLEPAAHGAALACGMKFTNSQEAIQLVAAELLFTTDRPDDFAKWLARQEQKGKTQFGDRIRSFVQSKTGASDAVSKDISDVLKENKCSRSN